MNVCNLYIYVYIYIYIEREREREREQYIYVYVYVYIAAVGVVTKGRALKMIGRIDMQVGILKDKDNNQVVVLTR
jgi:hypothetical protein